MKTTVGQVLVNEALPEDMRDYDRALSKKTVGALLEEMAERHPKAYGTTLEKLYSVGAEAATFAGALGSLSLASLQAGEKTQAARDKLRTSVQTVLSSPTLTRQQKNSQIVKLMGDSIKPIEDMTYGEGVASDNPLAHQVTGGARGNKSQLKAVLAGDLMVVDHKNRPIPVPILSSYAEGLDPVEYWAQSYGARKGYVDIKFATPKGSFLGKQLSLAAHRLVVTEKDCGTQNGIRVLGTDTDNEGAVLARDGGGMTAGNVLKPRDMRKMGKAHVVVRSPMTCQARNGICQQCAGVREKGTFPPIGDFIGLAAAQAISEPVTQAALSSKHTGGVAGAEAKVHMGGFDAINQFVQVPKTFANAAAISDVDGRVERIEAAPQGGHFISVKGEKFYAAEGLDPTVKVGDEIEAGDVLSDGIPNPAHIAKHKGIGAGRYLFMKNFQRVLEDSNVQAHRRNLELLSRGLVNHVRVTELDGPEETVPDGS